MAGKPKPPEERRSVVIPVNFTEDEARLLREAADATGIAYAAFLRSAGLSRAVDVRRAGVDVRQLTLPSAVPAPKVARRRGRAATS
jgi:hypothetical protein